MATVALTTLVAEPATAVAMVLILLFGVVVDFAWKRRRDAATRKTSDYDQSDEMWWQVGIKLAQRLAATTGRRAD